MSAPLLIAAMFLERRARRSTRRKHLLLRLALATIAGATFMAVSSPAATPAAATERARVQSAGGPTFSLHREPIQTFFDAAERADIRAERVAVSGTMVLP